MIAEANNSCGAQARNNQTPHALSAHPLSCDNFERCPVHNTKIPWYFDEHFNSNLILSPRHTNKWLPRIADYSRADNWRWTGWGGPSGLLQDVLAHLQFLHEFNQKHWWQDGLRPKASCTTLRVLHLYFLPEVYDIPLLAFLRISFRPRIVVCFLVTADWTIRLQYGDELMWKQQGLVLRVFFHFKVNGCCLVTVDWIVARNSCEHNNSKNCRVWTWWLQWRVV